jgi:protein-L-isoaspartate(D-aspartate) O-methyltransferase
MSIASRDSMVERQLARRGITDSRVLAAFREVPREEFVAPGLREFAYRDTPLGIGEGQTISQPYVVALSLQALALEGTERVLEIGTGSGYATALLSQLAREVFSVERHASLADQARERLARLGHSNVQLALADGSLGWPEHAPYDAIVVAAAAPEVPRALLDQLAPGGRLVIPVGSGAARQVLLRVTRDAEGFREEPMRDVRFVPLIGAQGFGEERSDAERAQPSKRPSPRRAASVSSLIREAAEPLGLDETDDTLTSRAVDALVERVGDARLVLLGEATHGTREFYRMRARISQELIRRQGFSFVAVEADWPDAEWIDADVLGERRAPLPGFAPFARFPRWLWLNREVEQFVGWLRAYNAAQRGSQARVGFHGLDLYSSFSSIAEVLRYLDDTDPAAAAVARQRYGMLTPWQKDPAAYGRAVLVGKYASSEAAVVSMLQDLLERRLEYSRNDGARFFDAAQNARVVAHAEAYYRALYYGSERSWNLRDQHMFETLEALLAYHGPDSRGIVWEHNTHVGDAGGTEMSVRGELNVGQLCRTNYGDRAYIVGFGTDHGSVAAASEWDGPLEFKTLRPAHADSYERWCHDAELPAFVLQLRDASRRSLREALTASRLERAVGVIYRSETELVSHYFLASLPQQFDEYVWFDATHPISPLSSSASAAVAGDLPDTYPFGL